MYLNVLELGRLLLQTASTPATAQPLLIERSSDWSDEDVIGHTQTTRDKLACALPVFERVHALDAGELHDDDFEEMRDCSLEWLRTLILSYEWFYVPLEGGEDRAVFVEIRHLDEPYSVMGCVSSNFAPDGTLPEFMVSFSSYTPDNWRPEEAVDMNAI